jgi:hypothetical protein
MAYSHSSKLRYDPAAYKEAVERSTGPLNYRVFPPYGYNCGECFRPYGLVGTSGVSAALGNSVDVDSILSGRTVLNSKANDFSQPTPLTGYKTFNRTDCSPFLETEYSRYTHPIQDYKGLYPDRFYPLQHDPQCHIFEDFAVNTKLQAKDNHYAAYQIPLEQNDMVPTERLAPKKN